MKEIAVVTGASRGIGRALTISLAKKGIKVFGVARDGVELEALRNKIPEMIMPIVADIATEEGRDLVLNTLPGDASVNYLVNNAAIMSPAGLLMDITAEQWRYQIEVNVGAPLFLIQKLLPKLQSARIINISNLSRKKVIVGLGAYAGTKSALFTLTNYLRAELALSHSISIASVYPGMVETSLKHQMKELDEKLPVAQLERKLELEGKRMSPETTAAFITWLLLNVSKEELMAHELWNIYDEFHRSEWIGEHKLPLLD